MIGWMELEKWGMNKDFRIKNAERDKRKNQMVFWRNYTYGHEN